MGPIKEVQGKSVNWQDSCTPHKTAVMAAIMIGRGILCVFSPVNMTHLLQTLDLIVNGPIKQHTRNLRCISTLQLFESYKIAYNAEHLKPLVDRKKILNSPAKPVLIPVLLDLFHLFKNNFTLPYIRISCEASMAATGVAPYATKIHPPVYPFDPSKAGKPAMASFKLYCATEFALKRHRGGGLAIIPIGTLLR